VVVYARNPIFVQQLLYSVFRTRVPVPVTVMKHCSTAQLLSVLIVAMAVSIANEQTIASFCRAKTVMLLSTRSCNFDVWPFVCEIDWLATVSWLSVVVETVDIPLVV
jgi:hypothetical protein